MALEPGTPAPQFGLLSHTRRPVRRDDLLGAKSMLVFMPYPFTSTCEAEACDIRDNLARLNTAGARVVMITTHAMPTNAEWAKQNGFEFDILADYWPHGEVSIAYDAFDERLGTARRITYFLDDEAIIRAVVESEGLGMARDQDRYTEVLASY